MDLGTKTQIVAQSALRIVARMKRDWIQTGRRPAGICAAALLIAARTSGFPRTQAEIVKIMRVCGMTVRTRLEEFESTPAAQLTMDELRRAEAEPVPVSNWWSLSSRLLLRRSEAHLFNCAFLDMCVVSGA
jgi:hypothetical protein